MPTTTLEVHGNLTIRGSVSAQNVRNYLGIRYARIPSRFLLSHPINLDDQTGNIDATEYGPRCPQPADGPREARSHLYTGIRPSSTIPTSEFDCLTLNVYMPSDIGPGPALPVFVWIHGGGWTVGDGNSEYDGNFQVEKSMELGKPFIFVSLNYRLGYYGFCHSQELKEDASARGEKYYANNGLYDQRLGLLWVKKHIHHFGGDASNVTIAGESAGGWCVLAHSLSDVPVCQQAMVMSCPLLAFPSPSTSQATFDRLVASTGVPGSASTEEKLAALRQLSGAQMESLLGESFVTPAWDAEWFTSLKSPDEQITSFDSFPLWVRRVVVGATKDESFLFCSQVLSWTASQCRQIVTSVFPTDSENLVGDILDAYGIGNPEDDATAVRGLLQLTSDATFGPVGHMIAEQVSATPVSVYQFRQADSFPESVFRGFSYHSLDNVFICRLPAVAGSSAPPEMVATADALSLACCELAYRREPWQPYQRSGRVMVFDGERSGVVDCNRDQQLWRRFVTTKERMDLFVAAGWKLIALKY